MKRYTVTLEETATYSVEVEAESEEEAKEAAEEAFCQASDHGEMLVGVSERVATQVELND